MNLPAPSLSQHCPRCGQENACAVVNGEQNCWCFSTSISPQALANLNNTEQCLCQRCATQSSSCASTDS